jgi:hypothetical protein
VDKVKLAENSVALASAFYNDDRADAFYEDYKGALGGFTGVQLYVAHAAIALTEIEVKKKLTWDGGEWIDTIDSLASFLLEQHQSDSEIKKRIRWLIRGVV